MKDIATEEIIKRILLMSDKRPIQGDKWQMNGTRKQYEVICVTVMTEQKITIVSFYNHQENKAKLQSLEAFLLNHTLMDRCIK